MKTSQKTPTLYLWDVTPHRMSRYATPKPKRARAVVFRNHSGICHGKLLHGAGACGRGLGP